MNKTNQETKLLAIAVMIAAVGLMTVGSVAQQATVSAQEGGCGGIFAGNSPPETAEGFGGGCGTGSEGGYAHGGSYSGGPYGTFASGIGVAGEGGGGCLEQETFTCHGSLFK